MSRAILRNKEIPAVLRHWQLNVAQIAPALAATSRLYQAPLYPHPSNIIQAIVNEFTPAECVEALETNQGGLRTLFETAVNDENCQWLATIPIFFEARALARGPLQRLLYRRLFLHTDFDSRLSPTLLGEISMRGKAVVRDKVLLQAVQYIEAGDEVVVASLDNLPWQQASVSVTRRAAVALKNDDNAVWRQLDIAKLGDDYIDHVPAKILAKELYMRQLRSQAKIKTLEREVDRLRSEVGRLERKLAQQE